ncbi:MAG: DMT family transporter [Nitrolancea sp.]
MKPSQLIQLLILGVLWGSSYLFIKVAVDGVDPVTLVTGRLAIGSLFLYTMMRARRLTLSRDTRLWAHILVMSLVGIIMPQVLIAWSEQHVTSSVASILNATTPFFTLIFAAAIFGIERFSSAKLTGLIVGFAGIAVLTGSGILKLASSSAQGEIALLLSSFGYGVAFAYARRFLKGEPLVLASGQMLLSAILLVPGMLLFGHPLDMHLNASRLICWIALGTFSSGVAYILYYKLIAEIGATSASFGTYLIPIVGIFWGWLLLGESVGGRTILGVAMILAGLVIATGLRRGLRARRLNDPVVDSAAEPIPIRDT